MLIVTKQCDGLYCSENFNKYIVEPRNKYTFETGKRTLSGVLHGDLKYKINTELLGYDFVALGS